MAKKTNDRIELPMSFDDEPEETPEETAEETADEKPRPAREFHRVRARRRKWTLVTGGIFVVLLIVAYVFVPSLPRTWQLLAALFDALLAGLVVHFAFDEFGRRYKRIKFPRIAGKKIKPKRPGTLAGWATALLVFAWWMTPLAPIRANYITAADLLAQFTDEVTQATLIQPHEHLAVLQRPVPPPSALRAAADIPDDADSFRLALRAMAQGKPGDFQKAREYLDVAASQGEASEAMIRRLRPLIDLYDGEYQKAAEGFKKALDKQPDDFLLACQTIVALTHAAKHPDMFAEAERLGKQLQSRAAEGSDRMTATNLLAAIYVCQGKMQEARELWAGENQEAAQSAGAQNNQGVLYANLANYKAAELKFRSAIRDWRDRWDDTRWKKVDVEIHVAPGQLNRGVGFYGVGEYEDAEDHLQGALAKFRDLPEDHSAKGVAAAALAMLYFAEGRYEEVEKLIRQANELFDKEAGTHTLAARHLSARLAAARGRYTEALSGLASLLDEVRTRLSPNHPFAAEVYHQMALVRMLQAEDDTAEGNLKGAADSLEFAAESCLGAIKIIKKYSASQSQPQGHWTADRVRTTLGRIRVRQKKKKPAAEIFELALRQLRTAFAEEDDAGEVKHPAIAEVLAAQADTQVGSKGKFKLHDAIKMYIDVLGEYGQAHPRVARWRWRLAKIEFAAGDPQKKARASLDKAIEVQAEKQPHHPHYAESLRLHAQILRKADPDDPAADEAEERATEVMENHRDDEAEPVE